MVYSASVPARAPGLKMLRMLTGAPGRLAYLAPCHGGSHLPVSSSGVLQQRGLWVGSRRENFGVGRAGVLGFGLAGRVAARKYSTHEEGLAKQLMSIPEVTDAQKLFDSGKFQMAQLALTRAVEIAESSRMPELMVLTAESLAHVYQVMGDFPKEQSERTRCCDILEEQLKSRDNNGESWPQEAYFRTLVQSCLSDITMGSFDETKTAEALEVCERLGRAEGVQLCGLIETLGTWATEGESDISLVAECEATCAAKLGNTHTMSVQASLLHGMALQKLGHDDKALAILTAAAEATSSFSKLESVGTKIEILQRLVELSLKKKDGEAAKRHASEALKAAEAVNSNEMIAACVHTLARVSIAQGDFVVGEGLLRSCLGRMQVPKGASPSVWELSLMQEATETYAGLLDQLIFNNNSRKAEGDMAREKLAAVEAACPVTAEGAKRLRKAGLGHWYRRYLQPHVPLLLQDME
mmetsp:Transcript_6273/g.12117  ORF Transcript_6273/g.12117 Transcript_6273/m.12117 type:complete len:468 (+) Transcript_6273:16-1419(+)